MNSEISNYILTDIKQKFSTLFPLLSQEEIREIVDRTVTMGTAITKIRETKEVCSLCGAAPTLTEIIEKKKCAKCFGQTIRKIFLEESPEKGTLGACLIDLKSVPKEIINKHLDLVSKSDLFDNESKKYTFNGKTYEIVCKRQFAIFSHVCRVTVYVYE